MEDVGSTQHASLLKKLHGDAAESGCDTIMIIEPDEGVRKVVLRILRPLFPGYEFETAGDEGEVEAQISAGLGARIALLIASVENPDDRPPLISTDSQHDGSGFNLSNLPIVLISENELARDSSKQKPADGIVCKPFTKDEVEQAVKTAIERRLGLSQEIEKQARWKVLNDFVDHYDALIPLWMAAIESMPLPKRSALKGPEEESDKQMMLKSAAAVHQDVKKLGETIRRIGIDGDFDEVGMIFHDINNDISFVFSILECIPDDRSAPEDVLKTSALLLDEIIQFISYVKHIAFARKRIANVSWAQIARGNFIIQGKQKLELPAGCVVCVVDDNDGVRKVCIKMIEAAGGKAYAASDESSLNALAGTKIQVFLLDHDLKEAGLGHELIPLIKELWPNALIIAHTSDANSLNSAHENPYKQAGAEIVDKREWRAISGVIRRKLQSA